MTSRSSAVNAMTVRDGAYFTPPGAPAAQVQSRPAASVHEQTNSLSSIRAFALPHSGSSQEGDVPVAAGSALGSHQPIDPRLHAASSSDESPRPAGLTGRRPADVPFVAMSVLQAFQAASPAPQGSLMQTAPLPNSVSDDDGASVTSRRRERSTIHGPLLTAGQQHISDMSLGAAIGRRGSRASQSSYTDRPHSPMPHAVHPPLPAGSQASGPLLGPRKLAPLSGVISRVTADHHDQRRRRLSRPFALSPNSPAVPAAASRSPSPSRVPNSPPGSGAMATRTISVDPTQHPENPLLVRPSRASSGASEDPKRASLRGISPGRERQAALSPSLTGEKPRPVILGPPLLSPSAGADSSSGTVTIMISADPPVEEPAQQSPESLVLEQQDRAVRFAVPGSPSGTLRGADFKDRGQMFPLPRRGTEHDVLHQRGAASQDFDKGGIDLAKVLSTHSVNKRLGRRHFSMMPPLADKGPQIWGLEQLAVYKRQPNTPGWKICGCVRGGCTILKSSTITTVKKNGLFPKDKIDEWYNLINERNSKLLIALSAGSAACLGTFTGIKQIVTSSTSIPQTWQGVAYLVGGGTLGYVGLRAALTRAAHISRITTQLSSLHAEFVEFFQDVAVDLFEKFVFATPFQEERFPEEDLALIGIFRDAYIQKEQEVDDLIKKKLTPALVEMEADLLEMMERDRADKILTPLRDAIALIIFTPSPAEPAHASASASGQGSNASSRSSDHRKRVVNNTMIIQFALIQLAFDNDIKERIKDAKMSQGSASLPIRADAQLALPSPSPAAPVSELRHRHEAMTLETLQRRVAALESLLASQEHPESGTPDSTLISSLLSRVTALEASILRKDRDEESLTINSGTSLRSAAREKDKDG